MFEHHRKSPWFAEKYDPAPEFVSLRRRLRKEGWRGRLNLFLNDLETGKYDSNEPEEEPVSPVKETNGTSSGDTEAINLGPSGAEEVKPVVVTGDEEMQNPDVEDEAGDNDAARHDTNGKGGSRDTNKPNNRGEEISVMPEGNQVMIRTIPPDIGRLRLEEVRC